MALAPPPAFEKLHLRVRKWIWDQGWQELRVIQEQAIPPILMETQDVLITAATAGGKTEAAFLPILSAILDHPSKGLAVLCLSPLKALINDQYRRLDQMGEALDIQVARWHGDVAASNKRRVLSDPAGLLLITPESLEALFVRQGPVVRHLFAGLRYLVIDEIHSFLSTERGRQLQSLLARCEAATGRRLPRIALSATLGQPRLACEFLRPGAGGDVVHADSPGDRQELKVQVRGYRQPLWETEREVGAAPGPPAPDDEDQRPTPISAHLFQTLRGTNNLVFANARRRVEEISDRLRGLSESLRVACEFWPHHGSLGKELREAAEAALKDPAIPATVVCTSTLELGIDIGDILSVAQIGPPPSVASLRQRLGRSGRRDGPAILRIYVEESEIKPDSAPQDRLRTELVQTIAMMDLLLENWYEPPEVEALHLSTLVQQVLSVIAERGGIMARDAWHLLCSKGAFRSVTASLFTELLRCLGRADLLVQMSNGELVLGLAGEKLVNHYGFYSAFSTPEEYRVLFAGKELGTLPITSAVYVGLLILFGGRRWRVLDCDDEKRILDVVPAPGGRPPTFGGVGARRHDRVVQQMRAMYVRFQQPTYLDRTARSLLAEGRENFLRLELDRKAVLEWGRDSLLFPWRGDRVLDTLAVWLKMLGIEAAPDGVAVLLPGTSAGRATEVLAELAEGKPPAGDVLASNVRNKRTEKYHFCLDESLLAADYSASALTPADAHAAVVEMLARDA